MNYEPRGNFEYIVRINNTYLAEGIKQIIQKMYNLGELSSSILVFDCHNYYSINFDQVGDTICVMLCEKNYQKFLPDINKIYRCEANITAKGFKNLVKHISNGKGPSSTLKTDCCINEREMAVIHSYMEGYSEATVSDWLGVNIKTIYLARRRLFSKLECNSLLEFRIMCRTQLFTEWYSRQKEAFNIVDH
ncbi:LuxR C-terminal-related transcriptional regulator [Kosakonia radicincitans]|uniref:LuxR C-terminal-related transcriptional regulator n=1 Tax=Kosakonia radicincitans TaxID=283686 RepID=UPI0031CFE4AA